MSEPVLLKSDLQGLKLVKRGKVRDVYEVEDKLLIVASDRMSAFDVVMDDPIPDKGKILTRLEELDGQIPSPPAAMYAVKFGTPRATPSRRSGGVPTPMR